MLPCLSRETNRILALGVVSTYPYGEDFVKDARRYGATEDELGPALASYFLRMRAGGRTYYESETAAEVLCAVKRRELVLVKGVQLKPEHLEARGAFQYGLKN